MSNYDYNGSLPLDVRVSQVMKQVYVKMFLGLVVTALVAMSVSQSMVYTVAHNYLIFVLLEVGLVIGITAAINKISSTVATLLFFLFAVVNGFVLSIIGAIYAPGAIAKTFFITAGTFGAMSVYGYTTNKDLTRFGTFLIFALFGLIIVSVVNMFMHSQPLDWAISIFGVFLFLGLTAWDTQKIKTMAEYAPAESIGKLATMGALSLYLDFINLFLYLLRIFGSSRN